QCSEEKPICRNCIRRGEECRFEVPHRQQPHHQPSALPQAPSPSSGLNMLDLELLHHFCTSTHATLSDDSLIRDLWRVRVVKLSFTCECAMLAILSLSALHLGHFSPSRRNALRETAISFHNRASNTATQLMDNLKEENTEGLFAFSILTIYFAFASSPSDGTWTYPPWMTLISGCKSFISISNNQILAGPFSCLMSKACQHLEAHNQVFRVDYVRDLRRLVDESVSDLDRRRIYNDALCALNQTFGVFYETQGQKDLVDIFYWVIRSEDFLPLLADKEQEALVIFAYFCVLLNKLSRQWWLDGWVNYLMDLIYSHLNEEHRTWIIWPMEELGWVPN
ncbi:hypothetical protein B0T10DRAFT_399837, partial [Thelonectria olida]